VSPILSKRNRSEAGRTVRSWRQEGIPSTAFRKKRHLERDLFRAQRLTLQQSFATTRGSQKERGKSCLHWKRKTSRGKWRGPERGESLPIPEKSKPTGKNMKRLRLENGFEGRSPISIIGEEGQEGKTPTTAPRMICGTMEGMLRWGGQRRYRKWLSWDGRQVLHHLRASARGDESRLGEFLGSGEKVHCLLLEKKGNVKKRTPQFHSGQNSEGGFGQI